MPRTLWVLATARYLLPGRRCRQRHQFRHLLIPGSADTQARVVRCEADRNHAGPHRGYVGWAEPVTWVNVGDRGPRP